jgi:hypothetical protein
MVRRRIANSNGYMILIVDYEWQITYHLYAGIANDPL